MKKGLLITALLAFVSVSMWAEDYPYVLRHCLARDTIATLQEMGTPSLLSAEADLTQDVNKVEVVQRIDKFTVAWYGPKWERYASRYADDDGYCWWICPELKEGETRQDTLASGSGTENHIGIIIAKGKYRFTIDYSSRDASKFIIERLTSSALTSVRRADNANKVMVDGVLYIRRNNEIYNARGMKIE